MSSEEQKEQKQQKEMDASRFEIGLTGPQNDPDSLVINMPLKHPNMSDDMMMDMCVGRCRRIEAQVVMLIKNRVMRKRAAGVVGADGKPLSVV